MDPTGAVVLDHVRKRVQQFVTDHSHAIEPCIGDPAAMDIMEPQKSPSPIGLVIVGLLPKASDIQLRPVP